MFKSQMQMFSTLPNSKHFTFLQEDFLHLGANSEIQPHFRLQVDDHVGGPPYQVSVSAYEELLVPLGFEVISIVDNQLVPDTRKGMEKVGRWRKKKKKSL
ncbi:probable thiol methyltransferase 2 [Capsella rubella]|uniref:probable thiol methyltransferase 2 n=1 Tax=Capsella rubella TaxID=81985 RepID=UPI000CD50954|nr:probable thiol methyltransferase 2 [Capsella rubella]